MRHIMHELPLVLKKSNEYVLRQASRQEEVYFPVGVLPGPASKLGVEPRPHSLGL
jgi:hypothetical protein